MTDSSIRLSPSGPIIGKGSSPTPGPGARIRLAEATSVMGGSQAIPTNPAEISPNGFGAGNPLVLTLDSPKATLQYRANLSLDVVNTGTSPSGEVLLYLDVSVDGGESFINRAVNAHIINSDPSNLEGRQMQIWMPLTLGSALGMSDAPPPASIKLRARANQVFPSTLVAVHSLSTSDGNPVTGLNGTIHMELEECL